MVLAFGIAILSTALISVLAAATISRLQFTRFALAGDRNQAESLAPTLGALYESYGNWSDVSAAILDGSDRQAGMMGRMMGGMMGRNPGTMAGMPMMMWLPSGSRLIVVDTQGLIVLDTYRELVGTDIPSRLIGTGVPISAGRGQSGHLFIGSMIERSLSSLESDYLRSILLALLAIMAPAAILSLFFTTRFASRLTGPIVRMGSAAGQISEGDLTSRVEEGGIGEIRDLSRRFNEMGEALERSDEQKKQMIADISHELRTPLTLIRGNLEAILDSVYPLDRDSVESIHSQAIQLEALVDDLRSLSMLDVGELEFRQDRLELADVIRSAMTGFQAEADAKSIRLESRAAVRSTPVTGDASRLSQVLNNLIGNAIRHTPPGGLVTVSEKPPVDGIILVEVRDTGEGIQEMDIGRIFDRFYRSDQSRTRGTGGTGLGLAISRKIVEAHGGCVGVESEPDKGSRFWFTIPVRSPDAGTE